MPWDANARKFQTTVASHVYTHSNNIPSENAYTNDKQKQPRRRVWGRVPKLDNAFFHSTVQRVSIHVLHKKPPSPLLDFVCQRGSLGTTRLSYFPFTSECSLSQELHILLRAASGVQLPGARKATASLHTGVSLHPWPLQKRTSTVSQPSLHLPPESSPALSPSGTLQYPGHASGAQSTCIRAVTAPPRIRTPFHSHSRTHAGEPFFLYCTSRTHGATGRHQRPYGATASRSPWETHTVHEGGERFSCFSCSSRYLSRG